jgi:hypothetical protein
MATGQARMPDAASLPSRSALPRGVDIPVLMSLMPEPLAERQARLWMAERLRERGYGTLAGER